MTSKHLHFVREAKQDLDPKKFDVQLVWCHTCQDYVYLIHVKEE